MIFLPKKDSQRQGDPSNDDPRHEPVEVGLNLITKIFCSEDEILETTSKIVLFPSINICHLYLIRKTKDVKNM